MLTWFGEGNIGPPAHAQSVPTFIPRYWSRRQATDRSLIGSVLLCSLLAHHLIQHRSEDFAIGARKSPYVAVPRPSRLLEDSLQEKNGTRFT